MRLKILWSVGEKKGPLKNGIVGKKAAWGSKRMNRRSRGKCGYEEGNKHRGNRRQAECMRINPPRAAD